MEVVNNEKKKTGKTKEIGGESTPARKIMTAVESEICQTCPATESEDEIIVPITVMKSGVYNSSLRTAEVVSKSTQLWEGIPIILERSNSGTAEHPVEGIVTSLTQVVGQLRDVYWDDSNGRIRGNGHFSEALGASPELIYSLVSGERPGVSGAYFRDGTDSAGEYEGVSYKIVVSNILPNNLAIVDNPACKECRINMESEDNIPVTINDNIPNNGSGKEINIDSKIKLEELNMVEETKLVIDELKVQMESAKKAASDKDMEITALKAKIAEMGVEAAAKDIKIVDMGKKLADIATESKKVAFLAQFPVEKREVAAKELLEPFMADAAGFLLQHGAKYAELLTVEAAKQTPKGSGKEFTPELDSEEKEYQALGVPSLDAIKKQLGVA
jgi:hypothetical protein